MRLTRQEVEEIRRHAEMVLSNSGSGAWTRPERSWAETVLVLVDDRTELEDRVLAAVTRDD